MTRRGGGFGCYNYGVRFGAVSIQLVIKRKALDIAVECLKKKTPKRQAEHFKRS